MKLWFQKHTKKQHRKCLSCNGVGLVYRESKPLLTLPEKLISLPYLCETCKGLGIV
ncbi:hypothetical protein LCGC14_1028820 [marine sediment metagenome]|uniref:Uncharacterized protein n=1 Tax=marine sediment metagenome TaxID=412755 RepID=A0A0F9MZS2_9ZZZZ